MLNIINIQFEGNKNTDYRIKKENNQGNIVSSRPKTVKHPYKIISVKEFPRKNFEISKNSKNKFLQKGTNLDTLNNINKKKKNISFIEENSSNRNNIQYKHIFDHSSFINNKDLFLNYKYINLYDRKIKVFLKSQKRKDNLLKNKVNEIDFKNNKKFVNKRSITSYKKKVSSFSMNKYIENYIEKDKINELKHNNKSLNTFESIYLNKDDDYNNQVIKFLSDRINKDNLKRNYTSYNNNYNYNHKKKFHTTNNIINKNGKNTRSLMIKRFYKNYPNNMTLNLSKNKNIELKPYVVSLKEKFGLFDGANSISNYNFRKNYEYHIHSQKKQSARISSSKGPTENNIPKYRPLSAKIDYSIKDRNIINISVDKDKKVDKNSSRKFKIRIKTKSKKKKKYKIKIKKNWIFRSHENNSICKKYNRVFESEKNSDIFDYLIYPKDSENKINEKDNNNFIEFAQDNH